MKDEVEVSSGTGVQEWPGRYSGMPGDSSLAPCQSLPASGWKESEGHSPGLGVWLQRGHHEMPRVGSRTTNQAVLRVVQSWW